VLVLVLVLVLVQDVAVLALDLLPSPAAEDRTQTLQTLQTLQIELTLTVLSWYTLLTMNSRDRREFQIHVCFKEDIHVCLKEDRTVPSRGNSRGHIMKHVKRKLNCIKIY